jgi:hypothetical protein
MLLDARSTIAATSASDALADIDVRAEPRDSNSADVVGVRPVGTPCVELNQLGQSPDGEPMMCEGPPPSGMFTATTDA